jgi:hypothetical protein
MCGSGNEIESLFAVTFNLASVASLGIILLLQWIRDQRPSPMLDDSTSTIREDDHQTIMDEPNIEGAEHSNQLAADTAHRHSFFMVVGSFCLNLCVFVGQSIMVLWKDISPQAAQRLILFSVALCGLTGSIATAGIVATCSEFPSGIAMNSYFQGQAAGGLVVSIANFMVASWEDPAEFEKAHCRRNVENGLVMLETALESSRRLEEDKCSYTTIDSAAFFFFVLGSLILLGCIFGYLYIYRLQLYGYETVLDENDTVEPTPRIGLEMNDPHLPLSQSPQRADFIIYSRPTDTTPLTDSDTIPQGSEPETRQQTISHNQGNGMAVVYKQVQAPAWAIFLTFLVTLAMFPGWTSQLQSRWQCRTDFRISNDLFTPLTFILFNAGDLTGRILSGRFPLERVTGLSNKLVMAASFRVVIGSLLFTCTGSSQAFGVSVPSDLYSLAVQFTFAISSGFLVTLSFAHAPRLLTTLTGNDAPAQERMSEILSFALSFGLLIGSFCSYPISKLAT